MALHPATLALLACLRVMRLHNELVARGVQVPLLDVQEARRRVGEAARAWVRADGPDRDHPDPEIHRGLDLLWAMAVPAGVPAGPKDAHVH